MYPFGICIRGGPLNLELLAFAGKPALACTGTNRTKSMKPGEKIRRLCPSAPQRTGLILLRDGIFVSARENIGRTLILVDFGEAGTFCRTRSRRKKGNQSVAVEVNERRPKW
jgi:hypothetical protein